MGFGLSITNRNRCRLGLDCLLQIVIDVAAAAAGGRRVLAAMGGWLARPGAAGPGDAPASMMTVTVSPSTVATTFFLGLVAAAPSGRPSSSSLSPPLAALSPAAASTTTTAAPKVCDVITYGAQGDNATDDTRAFVSAIASCSGAPPTGRGVVVAKAPGRYLLKPLQFQSDVELQIDAGATLVLWGDLKSYPNYTAAHVRPGGQIPEAGCFDNTGKFGCISSGCSQGRLQIPMSFLWGENVTNVAIGGGGTIDGQGLAWWLKSWWKRRDLNMYWRPKLFEFPGATDLTIGGAKGLLLRNSPMWNTALHSNTRLRVTNVTVHSPHEWINTDGINFSGEDIYVADCTVFNGDVRSSPPLCSMPSIHPSLLSSTAVCTYICVTACDWHCANITAGLRPCVRCTWSQGHAECAGRARGLPRWHQRRHRRQLCAPVRQRDEPDISQRCCERNHAWRWH
jgi:hypothetical protein